jgi:hypothetical protein
MEDYSFRSVYVEPVDGEVMAGCQPCDPFRSRISGSFGKSIETALKDRSGRLKVALDRESADYMLQVKVVKVEEQRLFFKLPIGFGAARDTFEFWLKLVDTRTQKIAFAYRSKGSPVESEQDLQAVSRWVVSTLDQFGKDHN